MREDIESKFQSGKDQAKPPEDTSNMHDYEIWFSKASGQKQDAIISSRLYVKNIDKKVERKDLIVLLLPFFNNQISELEA